MLNIDMKNELLTIIPARGGSKGIPKKNIKLLVGKPLLEYTADAAKNAGLVSDNILLSSDDAEILAYGRKLGITKDYTRPEYLASDNAGMMDVVLHAIDWWEATYKKSLKHILLLQPTSPLRTAEDIISAITEYSALGVSSLVGVHAIKEHPYECVHKTNGHWEYLCKPTSSLVARQQYDTNFYYINGAIYMATVDFIKKHKSFLAPETHLFVMDKLHGVDVDEPIDLLWAEFLLTKNVL